MEEEIDGVKFDKMPIVTEHEWGHMCAKHGEILMKDMMPNEKTRKALGKSFNYISKNSIDTNVTTNANPF